MNYIILILLFLILCLLFSGKENFASTQDYIRYLDDNIRLGKYIPAQTVSVKKYTSLRQQNNSPSTINSKNNDLLETACPSSKYNYIIVDQGGGSLISDTTGSYHMIKYKCMKSVQDSSPDGKIQHIRNPVDRSPFTIPPIRVPNPDPTSTFVCPNGASQEKLSVYSVWSDPTNQYTHTTIKNSTYDRDDFRSCQ
jgi:hypothetical protein